MLENQLELQAAEMERIDGITAECAGSPRHPVYPVTRVPPLADQGKCRAS